MMVEEVEGCYEFCYHMLRVTFRFQVLDIFIYLFLHLIDTAR